MDELILSRATRSLTSASWSTYALCCHRMAPVSTSMTCMKKKYCTRRTSSVRSSEVWTLPVRKYLRAELLAVLRDVGGIEHRVLRAFDLGDHLALPCRAPRRDRVRLDQPRLGLAQDRPGAASRCARSSRLENGKIVTTVLPRPWRQVSITGDVRRLLRFSLSICWMSCLSRPVLMAAESIPGSCEPRTYSLRAQPAMRSEEPTAIARWFESAWSSQGGR